MDVSKGKGKYELHSSREMYDVKESDLCFL